VTEGNEGPAPTPSQWSWASLARGLVAAGILLGGLALARYYEQSRHTVNLEINGVPIMHRTHARSGDQVLDELGIQLHANDSAQLPSEEGLIAGERIELQVARRIWLTHDGSLTEIYTQGTSLGDALEAAGVSLYECDEIRLDGERLAPEAALPEIGRPPRAGALEWISAIRQPLLLSIRRGVPLTVDDDGIPHGFSTTARTVGEALYEQGIALYQGDRIFPATDARVTPGLTISISRSRPVTLEVDGATRLLRTRVDSVDELLDEYHITLDSDDYTVPERDVALAQNLHVAVIRVYEEYYVEETPIPFETRWEGNPELEIDQRRTAHWGSEGAWRQQVRVYYENGQEVHRVEEEAWIAREPQDRILEYGTKIVVRQLQTDHGVIEYWRKIRVLATSYNAPTAGKPLSHPTYGITRLGERARKGIIAVDPKVIPLRQPMYVPGYGLGYAGDTGGAIKDRRIDLCYDDHNLVLWYRWVDVYLLTPVPPRSQIAWTLPNNPRERE
jgi:resuscitation-promoting factor RpfB